MKKNILITTIIAIILMTNFNCNYIYAYTKDEQAIIDQVSNMTEETYSSLTTEQFNVICNAYKRIRKLDLPTSNSKGFNVKEKFDAKSAKLIESNLGSVNNSLNNLSNTQKAQPEEITYTDEEKIIIDKVNNLTKSEIEKMSKNDFMSLCDRYIAIVDEESKSMALPLNNNTGTNVRELYNDNTATTFKEVSNSTTPNTNNTTTSNSDFWNDASDWWNNASKNDNKLPEQATTIINTFSDMINIVGTTLIVIATIIIGIKYIFGSVEDKGAAKEGLITLFVACIFFFGWTGISNLLFDSNNNFYFTQGTTSYTQVIGRIMAIFSYVAQMLMVIAVIYVGIKYIFAGSVGRAELKGKSVYFFIGIVLAFATTNVLTFISKVINDIV